MKDYKSLKTNILYQRVSSKGQEDNTSLDYQKSRLQDYCKANKIGNTEATPTKSKILETNNKIVAITIFFLFLPLKVFQILWNLDLYFIFRYVKFTFLKNILDYQYILKKNHNHY